MIGLPVTLPEDITLILLTLAGAVWLTYELIKRVPPRINEKIKTDEMVKCARDIGKDLDAHKLFTAENYVTKEELRDVETDIQTRLIRIEDFLINNAGKRGR